VRHLRRLIELDAQLIRWLADRLGFWRLDVVLYLARAISRENLAAQLESAGCSQAALSARESAGRWRDWAEQRTPERCKPA